MQFIDKMGEGGGGSVYPLLHSVPHEAQHRVVFKGLKKKINYNLISSIDHFQGNK